MSKRKIEAALKKKNIKAENIEFQRSCPVPEGYATGWDLEFSEATEYKVWQADKECEFSMFEEFDSLKAVLDWIEKLPVIDSE